MLTQKEFVAFYFIENADTILEYTEREFSDQITVIIPMDLFEYTRLIQILDVVNKYALERNISVERVNENYAKTHYGNSRCIKIYRIHH